MSTGFTEIREYLADAISDDTQYQTFMFPPAVPIPQSISIAPGSPWIVPSGIKKSVLVNWTVTAYANSADNQSDLVSLENIISTVIGNIPGGVVFSEVSQPQVVETTQNVLTTCELTLSVVVNIEG